MKDFLEYVARGLVSHPEDVEVEAVDRRGQVLYEIRVHPDDVGQLIGRRGTTINAIRSLATVGAAIRGRRCSVEVVDEDDDEEWDGDEGEGVDDEEGGDEAGRESGD